MGSEYTLNEWLTIGVVGGGLETRRQDAAEARSRGGEVGIQSGQEAEGHHQGAFVPSSGHFRHRADSPLPSPSPFALERTTLILTDRIQVNPDIMGGLVVEIGDRTIDLSVSSRIHKMNKLLTDAL